MPYELPNGRLVAPNRSFVIDGVTFSRGWLKTASEAEKVALGISWVDPDPVVETPRPITTDQVTAHAEHLIERGVVVNLTGITEPVYVQGRDKDTRNVQGLVTGAQLRLGAGDTTTLTDFRDGNNVTHQMTPMQVIEMWQKSAGYITAVYQASWAIKADDPIGDDFRDDERWPDDGGVPDPVGP